MKPRTAIALLLVFVPALVATQKGLDARLGTFRAQEEALFLWSGRDVKRMAPGFENLLADLYWLRTVQYFGGQRAYAQDKKFELLEPLIEITTTLDPRLEIAYRYGAIFLSEPKPIGAGRPREGVALLERGMANLPTSWRMRQDLGFFTSLFLNDSARAAEILREAARVPGAPYWLETLAASILAKGGDRPAARRMWQQMYDQAEEGAIKANALEHLRVLGALDQADRLQEAVKIYERQAGHLPRSLAEVAAAGLTRESLVDDARIPFAYDSETGTVDVSKQSPLWRPK
jgi:tetratricopeptide (TPR) repeat protein